MSFKLGNHTIEEILFGVGEELSGELIFSVDQLMSAQIEISADSTDITDKYGNLIRRKYKSKQGTFTSTNAMLHPALMNLASGSDIEKASATNLITMPRVVNVEAGKTLNISDAKLGTVKVIGTYGNGANNEALTDAEVLACISGDVFTAPEKVTDDDPIQYTVVYKRDVDSGIKLVNDAEKFPEAIRLLLACSYSDPCGELKACYVELPRFVADPSTTISLDSENVQMDFNGSLNVDFCSTQRTLYTIYYPENDAVESGEITG